MPLPFPRRRRSPPFLFFRFFFGRCGCPCCPPPCPCCFRFFACCPRCCHPLCWRCRRSRSSSRHRSRAASSCRRCRSCSRSHSSVSRRSRSCCRHSFAGVESGAVAAAASAARSLAQLFRTCSLAQACPSGSFRRRHVSQMVHPAFGNQPCPNTKCLGLAAASVSPASASRASSASRRRVASPPPPSPLPSS